jgi:hypothetical protein
MNTLTLKASLTALTLLVSSMAAAEVVFSTDRTAYDFDAANTAGADYKGYFIYEDVQYGVGQNDFDFSSATEGFHRLAKSQNVTDSSGVTGDKNVVYRFYNQTYSTVIGNLIQGDNTFDGRSFIKGVVGDPTAASALTASTTYNYEGVVFNHIASGDGTLNYSINVDATGAATGSGTVSGISGDRELAGGAFTIAGTLDQVSLIADASGDLAVATGSATLTLTNSTGTNSLADSEYSIGVYGPNAEEVAGALYTSPDSTAEYSLQELVSGYGLAGELTSTTTN